MFDKKFFLLFLIFVISAFTINAKVKVTENKNISTIYIDKNKLSLIKDSNFYSLNIDEGIKTSVEYFDYLHIDNILVHLAIQNQKQEIYKLKFIKFEKINFDYLNDKASEFKKILKNIPKLTHLNNLEFDELISKKIINISYMNIRALPIVKLQILPIAAFENEIYSISEMKLEVETHNDNNPYSKSKRNFLVSLIDNPKSLDYISDKEYLSEFKINKSNTNEKVNNSLFSKFLDKNIKYLKITTDTSTIYRVPLSDVLNLYPEIKSKDYQYLNLENFGYAIPFYYQSSDNLISEDDIMYFMGDRLKGDTTFYDHYSEKNPYFLSYQENKKGKLLKLATNSNNNYELLKLVNIKKHLEQENTYSYGKEFDQTETVWSEGWFWQILNATLDDYSRYFRTNFDIFPSDDAGDSIKIMANYISTYSFPRAYNVYSITSNINEELIRTNLFEGIRKDSLIYNLSPSKLFSGSNPFDLISNRIVDYPVGNQIQDSMNCIVHLDYFEISGKQKPFALNNTFDFSTDSLLQTKYVEIPGFTDQEVFGIDTVNQIFYKNQTRAQSICKITAKSYPYYAQVKFDINNKEVYNSGNNWAGIYLITCNNKTLENVAFARIENQDKFIDTLDQLNKNQIMTIVFCGVNPSDKLIKKLQTYSANQLPNPFQYCHYILTYDLEAKTKIFEKISFENMISAMFSLDNIQRNDLKTCKLELQSNMIHNISLRSSSIIKNAVVSNLSNNNLKDSNLQADVLVIYHKDFENGAREYARFRKESKKKSILLANIEDIYDQFYQGKKSPFAIKSFLKFALANYKDPKPEFVLLIGDASFDAQKRMITSKSIDFIPTFGIPASDAWYAFVDDKDSIFDVNIGRLPVNTNAILMGYIDKLKEFETAKQSPWMKNFLGLSGGLDSVEILQFYGKSKLFFEDSYINFVENTCFDSTFIKRSFNKKDQNNDAIRIINQINKGKMLTNYIGHGAGMVYDMDGWYPSLLQNKGKYGILNSLSCNTGAFSEATATQVLSEDYCLVPNRGFVGVLSSSFVDYIDVAMKTMRTILVGISNPKYKIRNMGELTNFSKSTLSSTNSIELDAIYQYNYLGDPLLDLPIDTTIDAYFNTDTYSVSNKNGSSSFAENDSTVYIKIDINNAGIAYDSSFKVRLIRTNDATKDTLYSETISNLCSAYTLNFNIPITGKIGTNNIEILIDPDKTLPENNTQNNIFKSSFDVFRFKLLALEPMDNWDVKASKFKARVINPFGSNEKYNYRFILQEKIDSTQYSDVYNSKVSEIDIKENYIDWNSQFTLSPNKKYRFLASHQNKEIDEDYSSQLIVYFNSFENIKEKTSKVSHIDFENFKKYEGIRTNTNENGIGIRNFKLDFEAIGVHGFTKTMPFDSIVRWTRIKITNNEDQNQENILFDYNFYYSGMHLLLVHKYDLQKPFISKDFYTYKWYGDTVEVYEQEKSLCDFLADTVDENYYLILATSDEFISGWQRAQKFNVPHRGRLDSLISILKQFGAKSADSLNLNSSYALFGYKGTSTVAPKDSILDYDTAEVRGILPIQNQEAQFRTTKFGPARKWDHVNISGNQLEKSIIKIFAWRNDTDYDTLYNQEYSQYIDIVHIDAKKYPFIQIETTLKRENINSEPIVNRIDVEFSPTPELAIIKSKTIMDSLSYERGYNAKFESSVENIALRSDADSIDVRIDLSNSQNTITNLMYPKFLAVEEKINIDTVYSSEFLDQTNNIKIETNTLARYKELYQFNNFAYSSFDLREDKGKPWVKIYFDSLEVQNKSFIQEEAKIEIQLFDASPLAIYDSNSIFIRINAQVVKSDLHVKSYKWLSYGKGHESIPNLKASLFIEFYEKFDFGENLFYMTANDSRGNFADSVNYKLLVARTGSFKNIRNSPNPFAENTKIQFEYIGPENDVEAEIKIYDLNGKNIKTLKSQIDLGTNSILWDTKDDYSNSVASGIYYYTLTVPEKEYLVNTEIKKMLLVK